MSSSRQIENCQARKENVGKIEQMKVPTKSLALILVWVAGVYMLALLPWLTMVGVNLSQTHGSARTELTLSTQKTLDDMHATIQDLRAKASRLDPAQRQDLEQQLVPLEQLLWHTQDQLLLAGAEDEATHRRIDQSLHVTPTPQAPLGKAANRPGPPP